MYVCMSLFTSIKKSILHIHILKTYSYWIELHITRNLSIFLREDIIILRAMYIWVITCLHFTLT